MTSATKTVGPTMNKEPIFRSVVAWSQTGKCIVMSATCSGLRSKLRYHMCTHEDLQISRKGMEGSGKAEQWIDQTYLGLTWIGYLVLLGYDLVNLGLPAWCTWVYLGLLYAGLVDILSTSMN